MSSLDPSVLQIFSAREDNLLAYLKAGTVQQHRDVEKALDLLRPPIHKPRIVNILLGFHGFHSVWEAAISTRADMREIWRGRARIANLRGDLLRLGVSEDALNNAPLCHAAAHLVRNESEAVGSLYVMEGSTLGGRIIVAKLAEELWFPSEGLRYFDPHGLDTGRMWHDFRLWGEARAHALDWGACLNGARATFSTLQHWLAQ